MPRRAIFTLSLASICNILAGCGTVMNLTNLPPTPGEGAAYRGTAFNMAFLLPPSSGPQKFDDSTNILLGCYAAIDLPFTLIGDTLTLPYTVPYSLWWLWQDNARESRVSSPYRTQPLDVGEVVK